jgi:hypothetical protein
MIKNILQTMDATSEEVKASYMLYLTPLVLFTGFCAALNNLWVLAFAEWALFASSIYYWSHHVCKWRRLVDVIVVQASFYVHLYFALRYESWEALKFYAMASSSYIVGVYCNSYIAHGFVWIFGCIANLLLIKYLK